MSNKKSKIVLEALGIALALLFLFPFFIIVVNSLKTQREFFQNVLSLPSSLYLENYIEALKEMKYFQSLLNTFIVVAGSLFLIVIFGSMAAWRLARTSYRKSSRFIYFFLVAGMLIPFQGIMLPFVSWVSKLKLMNLRGMWFIYMGFGTSMAMFLFHGFVNNIPKGVEEAAIIDGCNTWQLYWKIVFKLLKPIMLSVIFLDLIWIWNDYLMPSLIINQPGMQTLPLMAFQFFGGQVKKWSLALSGLVMTILPVIVFYAFAQKYVIKGITDGAVK